MSREINSSHYLSLRKFPKRNTTANMGLKKPDSKTRKPAQTGSSNLTSKSKSSAKVGPKRKNRPALTAKPEIKTKRTSTSAPKKKKRTYTAEELGVPTLNGIVPAGVQKPKGKKIGKRFVDDAESMMAIMAVVNAEKEGERESKIMKSVSYKVHELYSEEDALTLDVQRQLEEIREAKKEEAEKRQDFRKEKLVCISDDTFINPLSSNRISDFKLSRKKQKTKYVVSAAENQVNPNDQMTSLRSPVGLQSKENVFHLADDPCLGAMAPLQSPTDLLLYVYGVYSLKCKRLLTGSNMGLFTSITVLFSSPFSCLRGGAPSVSLTNFCKKPLAWDC
jgi:60S ribosomal subunit assembly/export protein LOC1